LDQINSFKCVCQLGYAGRVCETSKFNALLSVFKEISQKRLSLWSVVCGLWGRGVLILIVFIEFEQRPLVLVYAGHILKFVCSPHSPRYR
jgi:hypothetical protein